MTRSRSGAPERAIRHTGARVTRSRARVLAALLAAERALTHREIENRLGRGRGIDRVTLYRVLEWLTASGLAHRISGDDRIWRFNAVPDEHEQAHHHAHFKCNSCGEVLCLDTVQTEPGVRLPTGYRRQQVELTVKGWCAGCLPSRIRG